MATAKHYNHFTLEDRKEIENGVIEGRTLTYIANKIDVSPTSISRELMRNRRSDGKPTSIACKNDCAHRKTCKLKRICNPDCKKKCSSCAKMCKEGLCENYERQYCKRTCKAPWVCNGCEQRHSCPLPRWTYSAKVAQTHADSRLSETRQGLDMTGHEMKFLALEVKKGLDLGQSVHHIFASRNDLPCSERSFYRHVENEAIDVRKMDLRKKVKYKKRNKNKANRHNLEFYEGRTFNDYMDLSDEVRANTVQIDCVEGTIDDTQAILTLHFVSLRFQIYILLEKHDSDHVVGALDWLEELCGPEAFEKLFGVMLADRGSEFDDIEGIVKNGRCSIYYTDPQRPDQKTICPSHDGPVKGSPACRTWCHQGSWVNIRGVNTGTGCQSHKQGKELPDGQLYNLHRHGCARKVHRLQRDRCRHR